MALTTDLIAGCSCSSIPRKIGWGATSTTLQKMKKDEEMNTPIDIVCDGGHSFKMRVDQIPQEKLPFDKEEALTAGKAVFHRTCLACDRPPKPIIKMWIEPKP